MILPDEKSNLEVKRQVYELYRLERENKERAKIYEEQKNKLTVAIKNYMYCNKGVHDSFQFRVRSLHPGKDDQMVTVKKIEPSTVNWDAEKLEQVLDKKISKQIVTKTYTINDMPGLAAYLKECGVDPRVFKEYIDVEKKIDVATLEQLDALGKIDRKKIQDCYTVDKKKSYLRISMAQDAAEKEE